MLNTLLSLCGAVAMITFTAMFVILVVVTIIEVIEDR